VSDIPSAAAIIGYVTSDIVIVACFLVIGYLVWKWVRTLGNTAIETFVALCIVVDIDGRQQGSPIHRRIFDNVETARAFVNRMNGQRSEESLVWVVRPAMTTYSTEGSVEKAER
jgi:hypothetical protein